MAENETFTLGNTTFDPVKNTVMVQSEKGDRYLPRNVPQDALILLFKFAQQANMRIPLELHDSRHLHNITRVLRLIGSNLILEHTDGMNKEAGIKEPGKNLIPYTVNGLELDESLLDLTPLKIVKEEAPKIRKKAIAHGNTLIVPEDDAVFVTQPDASRKRIVCSPERFKILMYLLDHFGLAMDTEQVTQAFRSRKTGLTLTQSGLLASVWRLRELLKDGNSDLEVRVKSEGKIIGLLSNIEPMFAPGLNDNDLDLSRLDIKQLATADTAIEALWYENTYYLPETRHLIVKREKKEIRKKLSAAENRLLSRLLKNFGKTVQYDVLMSDTKASKLSRVFSNASHLRKRLDGMNADFKIETIRAQGYCISPRKAPETEMRVKALQPQS